MVIVGGGPGGCTAALYAARAGLRTVLLEKLSTGGQAALTDWVDNYPGFPQGIDGFTLGQAMGRQAEQAGAEVVLAEVTALDLAGDVKRAVTSGGVFFGRTLILATGASPKKLELPGETDLEGRGIYHCAACDGMRCRGKTVLVVGGGNTAASEALYLSRLAEKVILVHRRDTLRAEAAYRQRLEAAGNVEFRWNTVVSALHGSDSLNAVTLRDRRTGEEWLLPCGGLFVCIGSAPETALAAAQLPLDAGGYIPAPDTTRTSLHGVFAVGDIRQKPLRQIVTATADGAVAAYQAQEFLSRSNNARIPD